MENNLLKAERELVSMLHEIKDSKEDFSIAIEESDEEGSELALRQLKAKRSRYKGMVHMLSILTGEHQSDIKERIKKMFESNS